ncbi:hypothetical protein R5R35_007006 [Gryllus longicercus]|uniref:C2 domain-containing protein n=1 Tax=Gryllus longicercus TaxID=2509291 RepID=A0AAN9W1K9_9ORTH
MGGGRGAPAAPSRARESSGARRLRRQRRRPQGDRDQPSRFTPAARRRAPRIRLLPRGCSFGIRNASAFCGWPAVTSSPGALPALRAMEAQAHAAPQPAEASASVASAGTAAASQVAHAAGYSVVLYGLVSLLLVMLVVMLLYVACSKRYRLNWFEKNLLEAAETAEMARSQEALVGPSSQPGSSRTLNRSPSDDKFWVPPNLQRQASVCPSEAAADSAGEESVPGTPCTPCAGPAPSFPGAPSGSALGAGGGATEAGAGAAAAVALPLARSDKHVVLSTANPARPRVASMHTKLDHTKIDTSLYQKASPARTPSEPEDARGSLHLSLSYDAAAGMLTVRLIEAQDLQARDFSGTADPYAKIRLLPDRANVWQTRIHKRTLNPVFDEDFVFEVAPGALSRRTLELLLYDFDAYSRHHSIGGVQLPLARLDLTERLTLWKALVPCSEQDSKAELGDLMVSLCYLPSAERLTVVVLKGRNLRVVDDTRSSSDPFVRVSLLQNGKRVKKKKTGVHRNTVSPVFNEALTFDVSRDALPRCTLEFSVLHDSLLGPSELLGRALVGPGPDCRPDERDFFAEVLASKTATAQWLPLADAQ